MSDLHRDDPLTQMPDGGLELFKKCSQLCEGFSVNDVINAACAMLTNAIRQGYATRKDASNEFERMMPIIRDNLMNSYTNNGSRRQIFPHSQHVHIEGDNQFHEASISVSEKSNKDDPYR